MIASARVTWESRALEQPPSIVAGRQRPGLPGHFIAAAREWDWTSLTSLVHSCCKVMWAAALRSDFCNRLMTKRGKRMDFFST